MPRRPSGNKPKATGTPSGTRTAPLAGGNQPRTFKLRQTALSIIPQPREPTRTIVNRAGSRYPNPALGESTQSATKQRAANGRPFPRQQESTRYLLIAHRTAGPVPAHEEINREKPERPRHDDASPALAGTMDAVLSRRRESSQKAKAARRRHNHVPRTRGIEPRPTKPGGLSTGRNTSPKPVPPAREEQNPLKRLTRQQRSNIQAIAGIRHTTGTISLCHNQQRRSRARGDKPDQYS